MTLVVATQPDKYCRTRPNSWNNIISATIMGFGAPYP